MNELKFLKGAYSGYTAIESKDENAFYVTMETVGDSTIYALFLGTHLIASGNTAAALVQEISDRKAADQALSDRIAAFESGDTSVATLIQNAMESASAYTDEKVSELATGAVASNTAAIETLNGDVNKEGSVAKAIYEAKTALEGQISSVADDAKSYTISSVTEDLGSNVLEAWALFDEDGAQVGDTIKIYRDSSLSGVSLMGQELVFTYILADGTTKEVGVNVSTFLAESEFKDGLQLSENGEVSVKIAEAALVSTDATVSVDKNFLELESDGDRNKAMAVRSIDTDCTILQKDIVVAGLDSKFGAGNYSNNQVIPAGTDIYTILQNILCKELYPTGVTKTSASASASMSDLTLTLSHSGDVEVGTKITLNVGKTNGSSATPTHSKVTGMTYGYSTEDDDSVDSTATTISAQCTTAVSDNNYTVKATINSGFTADATTYVKTTPTQVSGVGSAELAETVLGCAVEGTNKITIDATGASYSYSADAIDGVYYCSNLGNTDSTKYYSGVSAVSSTTSKPTNSANKSVTGKYKYFLGYSDNTAFNQFDSDQVRALTTKSDWIAKDSTTTILNATTSIKSNGKSIVIACPSKYKLATISNGVGADILSNFSSVGEVSVKCGEINVAYKVYVYPITNSAVVEFKNVTLTKA